MKYKIANQMDFDYNIIDIVLLIENETWSENCWIKGFDDFEWKEADDFAKQIASDLNIEYVGEI